MISRKHFVRINAEIIVLLLLITTYGCSEGPSMTVEEIREEIQKDIPLGSHNTRVLAFLDKKNILHSEYVEYKKNLADKSVQIDERIITASILNVERRFFTTYSIYLRFFFDENGNLIDYSVRKLRDDP